MPFSHHSHSGQFCPGHAQNSLEEMVQRAIAQKMEIFALTEHMPRAHVEDLYPEEIAASHTPATTATTFAPFFAEASRLREKYASQIQLLIGFETEWIVRPGASSPSSPSSLIEELLRQHAYDFIVGSVHHVHGVPIDYDRAMYEQARSKTKTAATAGSFSGHHHRDDDDADDDDRLFEDYFDAQLEMLIALEPPVVGHFDLIRLKSDDPERRVGEFADGEAGGGQVWAKIRRNLDFIAGYGGILELNSSGLRKGLSEPYPQREICQAFMQRGGRFTLSDDSHSIDQVATNYDRLLDFIVEVGIQSLCFLERVDGDGDGDSPGPFRRFPNVVVRTISLEDLRRRPFWDGDGGR
ncbi:MAG: histidinolphosphatase [Sclerophora amabilis]|nr:MAG: histidinolphosphatase [Sclerophora amabilis]